MTMTHAEAIRTGAADEYVLGHLGGLEREAFEAHYFECPQCARAVESAAAFVGDVQRTLPSCSAPRPRRAWLPATAAAGFVLVSGALAYQTAFVVPALRGQVAEGRAIQGTPQRFLRVGRGTEDVVRLGRGQERVAFSLAVAQAYPFYRCQLLDARDQVLDVGVVAAPPGGPRQSELQILVTLAGRPPGDYVVAVGGLQAADGPVVSAEVARYRFVLRREEE